MRASNPDPVQDCRQYPVYNYDKHPRNYIPCLGQTGVKMYTLSKERSKTIPCPLEHPRICSIREYTPPGLAKHFEGLVIIRCNQKSNNFSTWGNRELCSRVTQDLGSHLVSLLVIQITQALMKILFSVQMFGGMPWQIYFQRALACKTPRKAQIVSFVASLCCLLMPIPAVLIGAVGVKTGKVRSECSLGQIRTLLGRPFVQRSL